LPDGWRARRGAVAVEASAPGAGLHGARGAISDSEEKVMLVQACPPARPPPTIPTDRWEVSTLIVSPRLERTDVAMGPIVPPPLVS
jgi:hypothetical protein